MVNLLSNLKWLDLIDILLITFLLYQLFSFFHKTKGFRILIGLLGLGIIYILVKLWGLFLSTWVFQIFWQALIILIIIVFQPEIRQVLERANLLNLFEGKRKLYSSYLVVEKISHSIFWMAEKRIGAIIIFKQKDDLKNLIQDGIPFDGKISEPILLSIFQKHSPIHDGAILIEENRIRMVAGYLPLTEKAHLPSQYGSRHRAALGLSERSDAFIIVVSEERGEVSVIRNAQIKKVQDAKKLCNFIRQYILKKEKEEKLSLKIILSKVFLGNWPKKLATFVLVFLFYIMLAGQQNYSQTLFVPIEYKNIPTNKELVSPPKKAKILIKGLRKLVASLKSEDIFIELDVALAQWGRRTYNITEGNINLPSGIHLEYIDPPVLKLDFR